ncbi:hypothetical protein GCM10025875_29960 [Litorihabitans aurantiacus]|uniref:Uncharacterized protein n=1 Tax=Litorihabitans aurantiacus TaxID=1930061 RepID=A0AA37XHJ4_9MICO|nr:hypothetical protein GCM10025875_29960 [Litorihabitans aurantiacus]
MSLLTSSTTPPTSPAPAGSPTSGSRRSALTGRALLEALPVALRKLDPRVMWRNPVMLVVEVGAVLTTLLTIAEPFLGGPRTRAARPCPVSSPASSAPGCGSR